MKIQFQSILKGKEKDLKKINTVELCLKKKKQFGKSPNGEKIVWTEP